MMELVKRHRGSFTGFTAYLELALMIFGNICHTDL